MPGGFVTRTRFTSGTPRRAAGVFSREHSKGSGVCRSLFMDLNTIFGISVHELPNFCRKSVEFFSLHWNHRNELRESDT